MASSSPLPDLTENFFLCLICMDQFKEPKLLPCLHRYCRDCLDTIIQDSVDATLKCPICKKNCEISKDGVNDFKTDFHMKNMLEIMQLEKSFISNDHKQCGSCSKKLKVSVYCFKCREFLCDQCGQFHENGRLFRDHKQHIVKLENFENQKLLMEKLGTVTENPRCHHHAEQEAHLCCGTCGNLPVCVTCVYGKHKGHDLHDVTKVVERDRESLKLRLLDINQHKDKLYNLPNKIEKSMKKLRESARHESEKIELQYEKQMAKIKEKMKEGKAEWETDRENIKTRKENEINDVRRKHDEEMQEVEGQYDQEFNKTDKTHDDNIKELERKLEKLARNFKDLTTEKEEMFKQNQNELQKLSESCEQLIKRYENFTATTSSILSSNDKWAEAQCIPDIMAASELLREEMKKEFPELKSLSNFKIDNLRQVLVDVVTINASDVSVIDVERSETKISEYFYGSHDSDTFCIQSVANLNDDIMVITGSSGGYAHITEINRDGKIQRQDKMRREGDWEPSRYCCRLSEFKLVTVYGKYEVGVYDVRDGSYNSKNIKNVIRNCSDVTCVTTDPVKNHIIVGAKYNATIYVFDDTLKYIKTIQMPGELQNELLCDICVHEGNLLVCSGSYRGSAYAVTLDGSSSHLMYEFIKPDLNENSMRNICVCTDKYGFIYILWEECISGQYKCVLLQYSRDGRQILTNMPVDNNFICMTTAEQDDEEFLVLATRDTGKLYKYKLEEK